jgi:hypothetical protein
MLDDEVDRIYEKIFDAHKAIFIQLYLILHLNSPWRYFRHFAESYPIFPIVSRLHEHCGSAVLPIAGQKFNLKIQENVHNSGEKNGIGHYKVECGRGAKEERLGNCCGSDSEEKYFG